MLPLAEFAVPVPIGRVALVADRAEIGITYFRRLFLPLLATLGPVVIVVPGQDYMILVCRIARYFGLIPAP